MVPKWERVTLKREGSIHKWEVEVIALPRRDNSSKARRKSQANADAVRDHDSGVGAVVRLKWMSPAI
jgi:hypothetical protein